MPPRSGIQQDVINLYRQGVKNVHTKLPGARRSFLLHLRYSFHHPPLSSRDFTAIEHQLRKMSRTLEMLSDPSVQSIRTSQEMEDWWDGVVAKRPGRSGGSGESHVEQGQRVGGDSGRGVDQWAGQLPGRGGT